MTSLNWPESVPVLTDGTVTLRAWESSDAEDVFLACQDPVLQHSIPVPVPYLLDHARSFVDAFAPQQWSSQQGAPFAAVDARSGRLLGAPSLKSVDHDRKVAEVGYWIAHWARGNKTAQRAVRLMCDWAFTDLGLRRAEFFIEPQNAASCGVAERLGAVRRELFPEKEVIRGTKRDIARYAIEK